MMILEQFLRMVNTEMEVWIKERNPKTAEEAAQLAGVFIISARRSKGPCSFSRDQHFSLPRPDPKVVAEQVIGPTIAVLINGQQENALVDTGSTQTLVRESLVPREDWKEARVRVNCVHGDERSYPTAEVYLTVDRQTFLMTVGVAAKLPYPVVLGQDLPVIIDLLPKTQQCMIMTKAQSAREALAELPFKDSEEVNFSKPTKPKAQKRREKFLRSALVDQEEPMPKPETPVDLDIPSNISTLQSQDPTLQPWFNKVSEIDWVKQKGKELTEEAYVLKKGILYQLRGELKLLVVPAALSLDYINMHEMLRWRSWEMAALALREDIANGRIRRERVFCDHYDFLAHDDDWLISRFRFPRAVLLELCAELGPVLERETARSRALPVPLQVLTMLGFLATGSFQRELADRSGISQSSLSRAMPAVLDGIICMSAKYIKFPYEAVDQANIKAQFAAIAGFPNVIGAIDCTHMGARFDTSRCFFLHLRSFLSDLSQTMSKRGKKRNFTECEVETLLNEVEARKKCLFGALSSGITAKRKRSEWDSVCEAVNAVGSEQRTLAEIKK
ncbi:hypothetical protein MHYP_G00226050 [Metynnis hypsauchen]